MTVGMKQMNAMFRDFKVAEDVSKMIELRRFEKEFELFGLVYWADGVKHYLVSTHINTIQDYHKRLSLAGCYPTSIQSYHDSRLMPAGWEEEIERDVKIATCHYLKEQFDDVYWRQINAVVGQSVDNSGCELLDAICDKLEGTFDRDRLSLFEGIMDRLYLRRNISSERYDYYRRWLADERQQMVDDITDTDVFSKVLYGFAWQNDDGKRQYVINAEQAPLIERRKKIATEASVVTPVFAEQIYYNYEYRLVDARKDYKAKLERIFDEAYFLTLQAIDELPITVDATAFRAYALTLEEKGAQKALESWREQGGQWGLCL